MVVADADGRLGAVFSRYGWDYDWYVGANSPPGFDALHVYTKDGNDHADRVEALHVSKWERFGNSVVQLVNVAALCQKHDIPAVYFESEHEFFDAARMSDTTGVPFLRRPLRLLEPEDGVILSGRFFSDKNFRLFSGYERQSWMDRHVLPLLPGEFSAGHPAVSDDSITVHFRAGDIFSGPVHPGYGQPPLEYYKLATDKSGARRVIVVYQDLGNPMVEPFIDYLRSSGREVVTQSSDLRSDLLLLFNSRELVSGRGSFLWSMHALSRKLRRFWYFHWPFDASPFARQDVVTNCISDERGEYMKSILWGNWGNTDEQRNLMLTYPADALTLNTVNA